MISTILGISLGVNSTRAGTDILPMIGPRTRPRKRSMMVQAAPPATWKNSSGHSLLEAMAAISPAMMTPTIGSPLSGTISKSGRAAAAACSASATTPGGAASSVMGGSYGATGPLTRQFDAQRAGETEGAGFEPAVRLHGLWFSRPQLLCPFAAPSRWGDNGR